MAKDEQFRAELRGLLHDTGLRVRPTRVTFATLKSTDGARATYGIYRGNLKADGTIDLSAPLTTEHVAYIEHDGPGQFCYRCAEENHAVLGAPPVPWQSHEHNCY